MVETQPPVPMVTLGRLGPGSSRQRVFPRHLVGEVEDLEAGHPPLLTKASGEGIGQYPGEALAQTSPPLPPPLAESWS